MGEAEAVGRWRRGRDIDKKINRQTDMLHLLVPSSDGYNSWGLKPGILFWSSMYVAGTKLFGLYSGTLPGTLVERWVRSEAPIHF